MNNPGYGDANLDGHPEGGDYAIWRAAIRHDLPGDHWAEGDFDYSGTADGTDYAIWRAAFLAGATR